ncbi:hypothetical protein R3P38DRAFT_3351365 [Favolaschia claudopus]|uniref:Uncharacterized protein n=1 Tax=Favolaschia claudopus TaxID=2862362 RepID=A0AAW0C524_9AGAR
MTAESLASRSFTATPTRKNIRGRVLFAMARGRGNSRGRLFKAEGGRCPPVYKFPLVWGSMVRGAEDEVANAVVDFSQLNEAALESVSRRTNLDGESPPTPNAKSSLNSTKLPICGASAQSASRDGDGLRPAASRRFLGRFDDFKFKRRRHAARHEVGASPSHGDFRCPQSLFDSTRTTTQPISTPSKLLQRLRSSQSQQHYMAATRLGASNPMKGAPSQPVLPVGLYMQPTKKPFLSLSSLGRSQGASSTLDSRLGKSQLSSVYITPRQSSKTLDVAQIHLRSRWPDTWFAAKRVSWDSTYVLLRLKLIQILRPPAIAKKKKVECQIHSSSFREEVVRVAFARRKLKEFEGRPARKDLEGCQKCIASYARDFKTRITSSQAKGGAR